MVQVSDYWSTIPLFILFREAIEASIIVSVLISFCRRKNAGFLERQVWWGVGLGVLVSLIFGVIFIVLYYKAAQNLFQGPNQMIFKGAVSWVACTMITYLAFTMLQFYGWEDKWKRKLDVIGTKQLKQAAAAEEDGKVLVSYSSEKQLQKLAEEAPPSSAESSKEVDITGGDIESATKKPAGVKAESWTATYAFFIAIFLTVIREGLESVVFLAGVGNSLTSPYAILLPGFVGIVCGLSVGFLLYFTGKGVTDIKWLLITMALTLFFIAAGQCELGAGWLLRAGVFGTYYSGPLTAPVEGGAQFGDGDETYTAGAIDDGYRAVDIRPWWMIPLWDVSGCCGDTDQQNKFFSLMKAIFGYNAMPCYVEVVAYCGYWFLVILFAMFKFYRRTLFDADYKHNRKLRAKAEEEEKAASELREAQNHPKLV